jgi:hypothetical protein
LGRKGGGDLTGGAWGSPAAAELAGDEGRCGRGVGVVGMMGGLRGWGGWAGLVRFFFFHRAPYRAG